MWWPKVGAVFQVIIAWSPLIFWDGRTCCKLQLCVHLFYTKTQCIVPKMSTCLSVSNLYFICLLHNMRKCVTRVVPTTGINWNLLLLLSSSHWQCLVPHGEHDHRFSFSFSFPLLLSTSTYCPGLWQQLWNCLLWCAAVCVVGVCVCVLFLVIILLRPSVQHFLG